MKTTAVQNKDIYFLSDYTLNTKLIIFIIIAILLMLMSIYGIRAYANTKYSIMHEMRTEADILENAFATDINYSEYFLRLITSRLYTHPLTSKHIQKVLLEHNVLPQFNIMFGWQEYSWIDANFREIVTNTHGIISTPRNADYVKHLIQTAHWQDQVMFYVHKTEYTGNSLKLIMAITDDRYDTFIGAMVLSHDIAVMMHRLNSNKGNSYTNFVIVHSEYAVVAQSQAVINNIVDKHEQLSSYMHEMLQRIDFIDDHAQEISYLDMLSGVNYYAKKIKHLPFVLVINLDSNEVRHNILDTLIKKFIEIVIFFSLFLLIVASIYRHAKSLRAKAEQAINIATKATQAKSDFLAFTAHEIRSPLGFILTGSEMMIKELYGPLPTKYFEYAQGIHQNAHTILDFIIDILDETQILANKFKMRNFNEDIIKIINQAIKINKTRFHNRKVEIDFIATGHIPQLICDKQRILQIMTNLISNAIKYSDDNTVVTISIAVTDEQLAIQIIDQGIGMSSEDINVIMESYKAKSKQQYHTIDSYGLGLRIAKVLLDAHDATLTMSSGPQAGTAVQIIFPSHKLVARNTLEYNFDSEYESE